MSTLQLRRVITDTLVVSYRLEFINNINFERQAIEVFYVLELYLRTYVLVGFKYTKILSHNDNFEYKTYHFCDNKIFSKKCNVGLLTILAYCILRARTLYFVEIYSINSLPRIVYHISFCSELKDYYSSTIYFKVKRTLFLLYYNTTNILL